MGKVNEYREQIKQTDDYRFGWESASRGEPPPPVDNDAQKLGWNDYHDNERDLGSEP
jgi:hypothetical protein